MVVGAMLCNYVCHSYPVLILNLILFFLCQVERIQQANAHLYETINLLTYMFGELRLYLSKATSYCV